jgi:hypothetical protein
LNQERTAKISGRTFVLLIVAAIVIGVLFVWITFQSLGSSSGTAQMTGSLFVSDSGMPLGGVGNLLYNGSLSAIGGSGTLVLVPITGPGDPLSVHNFSVSDFSVTPSSLSMILNGNRVNLTWTANDTVWNGEFDDYYIASWGSAAPASELRGSILPTFFPGLPSNSYVELRLTSTVSPPPPSFLTSPGLQTHP